MAESVGISNRMCDLLYRVGEKNLISNKPESNGIRVSRESTVFIAVYVCSIVLISGQRRMSRRERRRIFSALITNSTYEWILQSNARVLFLCG